ncbi:MAG: CopD family protein [Acetobacteraceae bacterium]
MQAAALVGGLPGLVGTAYGRVVLLKALLFGTLLSFAAYHRLVLTPALAGTDPAAAARRMRRSVLAEAAVGAGHGAVAAWLSAQAPGAHEQPVWPLPWQPTFQALDDPDTAATLYAAFALIAASLALAAGAVVWPRLRARYRLAGLAAAAVALGVAAPRLSLMAMPAYPTSFFESPLRLHLPHRGPRRRALSGALRRLPRRRGPRRRPAGGRAARAAHAADRLSFARTQRWRDVLAAQPRRPGWARRPGHAGLRAAPVRG